MFSALENNAGPGSALAAQAPHCTTTMMLSDQENETLISIQNGVVTSVADGPFVMPGWTFRLTASAAEWQAFLEATPKPGSHDLMAMLRRGVLRFEGDLHPLMSNFLYFKRLLASLRPGPGMGDGE